MKKTMIMEEICMKLLRLQVEKLYGHYNYDNIVFNSDVTFIYGLNGCGKTTILNITEAIITGQIYKLFNYVFHKIILEYAPKNNMKDVNKIVIVKDDEGILVTFKNQDYHIFNSTGMIKEGRGQDGNVEKARYYFHEYEFLLEIKRIFNYVYLPLNRSSVVYDIEDEESFYIYRHTRSFYGDDTFDEPINKDMAMIQIERLIRESCNRINNHITHISDTFRNNLLKSLLDVNEQFTNSDELLSEIFSQQENVDNSNFPHQLVC